MSIWNIAIVFLMMSSAVLADGAPAIASWIITGGPIAPLIASVWGIKRCATQISGFWYRAFSIAMTLLIVLFGYHVLFQVLINWDWLTRSFLGSLLFGPMLLLASTALGLFFSSFFGYLACEGVKQD